MTDRSVVVLGLPASGKTTYLAALWHLLQAKKVPLKLASARLKAREAEHLKAIAQRWLQARRQERTHESRNRIVSLELKSPDGTEFSLTFPDVMGEAFAQMWEFRECDPQVVESLRAPAVLLFIHSTAINRPNWIADAEKLSKLMGSERRAGDPFPWEARLAPTQVQLVDLLRCLQSDPLDIGPRRVAVILSAWDLAEAEKQTPQRYLEMHLPLLHQYLQHGLDPDWTLKVFGISAQGAEYDGDGADDRPQEGASLMRAKDIPSERINVVDGVSSSRDLTEPLHWLLDRA